MTTESKRVYLDTCVYNRPFDDQAQPRVGLETLAFSVILQMIEDGSVALRQPSLWNSKQRGVGDDSTCSRRSRGIA